MQNPEIKLNYLNVCVHSRSQDIVGFGHALVFVISLALVVAVAVAALPCLGLSTTFSRISLASLPQSPVLVSLTHSHTVSLSAHISSNFLTHTHSLACSLTHCSSTRQAFVRSFICRTLTTTTTKKFSRTAAARCPFTRLGLDWPRRVLLPGVFVLVFVLLCFTSYVLVCVLSPSLSLCMCVGVGVSSRRFVLCWLDNDNDNRATAAAAAEPAKTRSPLDASQ